MSTWTDETVYAWLADWALGRDEERAEIVAWLRAIGEGHLADMIKEGRHHNGSL